MTAVYLAGIALVTACGILLAARGAAEGRPRARRLGWLLALWVVLVGLGWPISRLGLDLAFVFGSQLTLLAALTVWLLEGGSSMTRLVLVVWLAGLAAPSAHAFSGGPQIQVTDNVPACASCHASAGTEQLRSLAPEMASRQTIEAKHYAQIASGAGSYKDLSEADRQALLDAVKTLDAAAKVSIVGPATVRRGETVVVTVKAVGGSGPVVGLALLDGDQRFQARPVTSAGWAVVEAPKVTGPDGKPQTTWVDKRMEGLGKNLAFVLVYGVQGSAERKAFPESQAVWTLRAPMEPGRYTVGAAFLHGTEKATEKGAVPQVGGGVQPRGGGGGPSGRVRIVTHAITVN